MIRPTVQELASLREDAFDAARSRDLEASARRCAEWDRAHPVSLEGILDWIEQLRRVFGDPPVDRTPWRGDDFRI